MRADRVAKSTAELERPTRVRYVIFVISCLTSWLLYLHRYTFGSILPSLEEEMGWSEETLGIVIGAFNLAYGIGQIPSGIICDWFGPHLFLGSSIVGWSLALSLVAIGTAIPSILAARVLFGLTQAGCYPALSKVTRLWFPLRSRTSAQGWIASFFGRAGGASGNFILGTVLMTYLGLGWRPALVVLTVVGALFGLLFLYLVRNSPATHPWSNAAEQALVNEGEEISVQDQTRARLPWSIALTDRNYLVFLFQQFTCVFPDLFYAYWVPIFLMKVHGFDLGKSGIYASLPLIGGAIGGSFAGMFQDYLMRRTGNRRWSRSSMGLVGNVFAGLLMIASASAESGALAMVILGGSKFFADWTQPTCWGTATDIGGKYAGTVFGIMNTVGSISGTISPWFMGFIAARYSTSGTSDGWLTVLLILSFFYFASALCWLFIDCTKRIQDPGETRVSGSE